MADINANAGLGPGAPLGAGDVHLSHCVSDRHGCVDVDASHPVVPELGSSGVSAADCLRDYLGGLLAAHRQLEATLLGGGPIVGEAMDCAWPGLCLGVHNDPVPGPYCEAVECQEDGGYRIYQQGG